MEEMMIHDNVWTTYSDADIRELEHLSSGYIDFLNNGKTERECTDLLVEMAEKNGYRDLKEIIANGEELGKGSKIYAAVSRLIFRLLIAKGISHCPEPFQLLILLVILSLVGGEGIIHRLEFGSLGNRGSFELRVLEYRDTAGSQLGLGIVDKGL